MNRFRRPNWLRFPMQRTEQRALAGTQESSEFRKEEDRGTAGFSLIDVLVALLILGAMTGLMVQFVQQLHSLHRLRADIAAQMELNAVTRYLEAAFAGAMSIPLLGEYENARPMFQGERDTLRFTAVVRRGAHLFGLRETVIATQESEGRRNLVQYVRLRRADPASWEIVQPIVLLENIGDVGFRYLDVLPVGAPAKWGASWEQAERLPYSIEFDLESIRQGVVRKATGRAQLILARPEPR